MITAIIFSSVIVLDIALGEGVSEGTLSKESSNKNIFRIVDEPSTNTTTTTTPDETNTTAVEYPGFNVFISDDLNYPLALIFSIFAIASVLWLIFFVETSKERTMSRK